MATASRTWAFASDAEGLTDQGVGAAVTFAANTGDGNPAGSVAFTCATKAITQTERGRKPTTGDTFASLFGLAAGDTVTAVRITGLSDKVAAVTKLSSHSVTVRLVDDAGTTIATLMSGRNPGITATAWVAVGAQSSQAISKAGSDGCRLEIEYTLTTGSGGGSASTDYRIDQIAVEVTYTPAPLALTAGKVATGAAVRGAGLVPSTAAMAVGKTATAEAVRGAGFVAGTAALTAGKAATGEAVRGAGLVAGTGVGKVATAEAVRGADLSIDTTLRLNGLVKDYDPPGGIDAATDLHFEPTARDWQAGAAVSCPQGWSDSINFPANAAALGVPEDTGIPYGAPQGTWTSGVTYALYDVAVDPTDGNEYTALVAGPDTTTQPHASADWTPAERRGFAVRSRDAGFYSSVQRTGDATRWFSCDMHARGQSGATEPAYVDGVDNEVFWTTDAGTYRGARTPSTAYTAGQWMSADGSIWQALTNGTTSSGTPTWANAGYGGTLFDGGVLWLRQYIAAGAWAANTTYGAHVLASNTKVAADCVIHSGGGILVWSGAAGTDGTTGGTEPAWSAASATAKFWEDGDVIWRFLTFAVSGDGIAQNERLVLTGLNAPATDGKTVTIYNDAAAGTARDVVLADQFTLGGDGTQPLPGSDKASAAPFDFGGVSLRLEEGESVGVTYSTATGLWTQALPTVAAGKVATGEAVRGASLAPAGSASLSAGRVATGEAVRGATATGSGAATLAVGRVTSTELVRGADVITGGALLAAGRIASGEAVRGANLVPGPVTLGAGHVASLAVVRGASVAGATAVLAVGHVASTGLVRGASVSTGIAVLQAGRVASGATARGAALVPGPVTLAVGRITTGAAVRGAGLVPGAAVLAAGRIASGAALRGVAFTIVVGALGTVAMADTAMGVAELADTPTGAVALVDAATDAVVLTDDTTT